MSDINPVENAAGQATNTAAVALQVLVMTAQALREHQQRQANGNPQPAPAPAPQPTGPPNPDHERYAQMVRSTVQPAAVAEAMVTAPQWTQVAGELKKLEASGVNVAQFLKDAAPVISRIDADLRAGAPAPGVTTEARAASAHNPFAAPPGERPELKGPGLITRFAEWIGKTAKNLWAKITGKDPSALGDRSGELEKHGISPQENARHVITAREALADEALLGRLVTSREWPSIAAQMGNLHERGHNPREALAGIPVRLRQAAEAGITLSPAEAARGLLNDQAKTPVPAPATTPTPPPARATQPAAAATASVANTTSAPAPAVPDPAARASAANSQSTTAAAAPAAAAEPDTRAAHTTQAPDARKWRTHGHGR